MIPTGSVQSIIGKTAYGAGGDKVGTIEKAYLDNSTGEPAWVTVKTGFFGSNENFVPLADAELLDDGIRVPYDKGMIKGAPQVAADQDLTPTEEQQLYAYYGVRESADLADLPPTGRAESDTWTGVPSSGTSDVAGTYDVSEPVQDDAMTRSEEQVRVGTERIQTGRARLRRYTVTEMRTITVPVTREEVRVEYEPVSGTEPLSSSSSPSIGGGASGSSERLGTDAPDLGDVGTVGDEGMVLYEERVTVHKEVVPVERVRLTKETVAGEEIVDVDVRSERIETDVDRTDR